jgi:hypothetical protein
MPSLEDRFAARGNGVPTSGPAVSIEDEIRRMQRVYEGQRQTDDFKERERLQAILLRRALELDVPVFRDPIYKDDIPHR